MTVLKTRDEHQYDIRFFEKRIAPIALMKRIEKTGTVNAAKPSDPSPAACHKETFSRWVKSVAIQEISGA
jgi:hypothetical protein